MYFKVLCRDFVVHQIGAHGNLFSYQQVQAPAEMSIALSASIRVMSFACWLPNLAGRFLQI
jgi:hypothetical protein